MQASCSSRGGTQWLVNGLTYTCIPDSTCRQAVAVAGRKVLSIELHILVYLTVHAGKLQQEEGNKGLSMELPIPVSLTVHAGRQQQEEGHKGLSMEWPIPVSLTVHAGKLQQQEEGHKGLSMSIFIRKTKKTVIRQYWRNRKKGELFGSIPLIAIEPPIRSYLFFSSGFRYIVSKYHLKCSILKHYIWRGNLADMYINIMNNI